MVVRLAPGYRARPAFLAANQFSHTTAGVVKISSMSDSGPRRATTLGAGACGPSWPLAGHSPAEAASGADRGRDRLLDRVQRALEELLPLLVVVLVPMALGLVYVTGKIDLAVRRHAGLVAAIAVHLLFWLATFTVATALFDRIARRLGFG